jgi:hypothetical protein
MRFVTQALHPSNPTEDDGFAKAIEILRVLPSERK